MKFFKNHLLLVFVLFGCFSCSQKKINGVSLVSPPNPVDANSFVNLNQINARWVAIIPYAFTPYQSSIVRYDGAYQWWGETTEGTLKLIEYAKKQQLKVMLKPHVWYQNAWIGAFSLITDKDWKAWEKAYTTYILSYAKMAQKENVELFCIGTELKQVVLKRPNFFKEIIKKIRKIYQGKLTYAANWNSVNEVVFWDELDYIGVDAYFPLSDQKQPTVDELNLAWQPIKKALKQKSKDLKKMILFTEYGFESCDYNTKTTWGSDGKFVANQTAQSNAYEAFFETFYNEEWFAGGFLWKWHLTPNTMRDKTKSFTPQGKKAMRIITQTFKQH